MIVPYANFRGIYNMVQNADDWGYFDPMPDYCPNCGAKMDGGADNACL